MARKHRKEPEHVQPDLPITPMLDMSFQLMAFFIFTFRPAPTEGQLAMALPKMEGGETTSLSSPTDDQPVKLVVRVESEENGTIRKISVLEEGSADARGVELGSDVKKYQAELKVRYEGLKGRTSKLTLEIGDGLLQEYVVNLYDVARGIGFQEIAPFP